MMIRAPTCGMGSGFAAQEVGEGFGEFGDAAEAEEDEVGECACGGLEEELGGSGGEEGAGVGEEGAEAHG